jgi:hypothetical protein
VLLTLIVRNDGPLAELELGFLAHFELVDTWFAQQRNQHATATVQGERLVARAEVAPEN